MSEAQLRQDVEFLAGRLPHRGANTENERVAAEYLHERFKECTRDATIDDFYSVDSYANLFALYYFDFLFVALFALWSPWVAAAYGLTVFFMYLAEISGYAVMGRLLPQYETQNVSARFLSPAPRQTLVVTAHYDSPLATILTAPPRARRLRLAHVGLVACMVVSAATCVAEGMNALDHPEIELAIWLRWMATTILVGAAFVLYSAENSGEYTRGAINNASGVAVLLGIARRIKESPLQATDIIFVATGSKETWLSGMQDLVRRSDFDKHRTAFINIDGVGGGDLCFTKGEGMLSVFRSSRVLVAAAQENAESFGARPIVYRGFPTDALVPLTRGYPSITIMGVAEDNLPVHWNRLSDTVTEVDFGVVARAESFLESIVRHLDRKPIR